MDLFDDNFIQNLTDAGDSLLNDLIIPIINFIIWIIQWPFGLGPYGQYAPAFPIILLMTILLAFGYRIRNQFMEIFIYALSRGMDEVFFKSKRRNNK